MEPIAKPLVSVMIITYNQVDYLKEALDSVLQQNYENLEIIVADDCSTDGTAELLYVYKEKHPKKIFFKISKENQGITKNSNQAWFDCSGKYVAILGGDDLFFSGKIQAQVDWLEADTKRVICGHPVALCDGQSKIFGHRKLHVLGGIGPKRWIEQGMLFPCSSIMLRRSAAPVKGFDERLPVVSDWKFCIDTLSNDSIYGCVNFTYGAYRRHLNNITNDKTLVAECDTTLNILEKERPELKRSINKARNNIVLYGSGIKYMHLGLKYNAICTFFKVLRGNPLYWKAYVRIIEVLFARSPLCQR